VDGRGLVDKTRKARMVDPIAVMLAVAVVGLLVSLRTASFEWLDGRLNGKGPGLVGSILAHLAVALLFVLLLVRATWRSSTASKLETTVSVVAIAGTILVGFLVPHQKPFDRFSDGFACWARGIDIPAIHRWRENAIRGRVSTQPTAAPYWFPIAPSDRDEFGTPIPRGSWPREVAAARPDEVRVLRNWDVLLAWGRWALWPRFLLIGDGTHEVPEAMSVHMATWRSVGPGAAIGIAGSH
jgi:hypothetical protein